MGSEERENKTLHTQMRLFVLRLKGKANWEVFWNETEGREAGEKDMGVLVDSWLNLACVWMTKKASGSLAVCGQQDQGSDCAPCTLALLRPHLACCVLFYSPRYRKDSEVLE